MNFRLLFQALVAGAICCGGSILAGDLEAPVKLEAGGKPIDVQRSAHAAPFVGDFDGDGVRDLLVGEFHEGRLRFFRNVGTGDEPRFGEHEWFKVGAELGRVPAG